MFTLDGVRKFHGWTHASLTLVLDHLAAIPPGDFVRELSGFGFPSLRDQAIHIYNCEGFWIHTLRGRRYPEATPEQYPDVPALRILQKNVSASTEDYLSSLSEEQLNADARLHMPEGHVLTRSPAFVLHHVLTHAFHHKGQIAAMCRALGHPISDTDLV